MFPEALATGLCSLRPQVDRLVQSCLMEIDAHGAVRRHELHDGVIRSDARMTYTEVNAILAGEDRAARKKYRRLVPRLELMAELFEVLNGRRRARGSVDFDLPEAEFLMDDQGRVEAIVAAERNLAHRLIEEFMLVATRRSRSIWRRTACRRCFACTKRPIRRRWRSSRPLPRRSASASACRRSA